jgi:uncharacterized protein (DUF2267 family)
MTTGLDVFDTTLQETNLWLKELMARLGIRDRRLAYRILRATLHTIRDRIGPENAVHLGAQLPMLIRGFYYEGWHMSGMPTKERLKQEFLDHVLAEARGRLGTEPEQAVRAVFEILADKIDSGEVAKLIGLFPEELRALWPRLEQASG